MCIFPEVTYGQYRARPTYQTIVLSHIRETVGETKKNVNIVEYVLPQFYALSTKTYARRLGAGTGIFTRALLADPEWPSVVGQLKAVEPSEGMRSQFSKTVTDPRVSVAEGTFDKTGVEDGWADLIVIAQVGLSETECCFTALYAGHPTPFS